MKIGAFYDMAHDVLDQASPKGWDAEETRRRIQLAWDSVDDRFGQVVYDNLFWHKALRDAAQLGFRSVGWTGGTWRTVIGSGVDTAVQGKKLLTPGETAEITDRMAFSWALAVYGALAGTVLTYLSTGHRPKDLKHAYYWLRADGSYDAIPGYPKNVIAMYEHPIDAIGNTLSPIIEAFEEAIHNEDFYHVEIRHKDDPILKQFGEFASWAAKLAATPFSFSGTQKMLENKGEDASVDWRHPIESAKRIGGEVAKHTGDLIAGNLGFQPAPAYFALSAGKFGRRSIPQTPSPGNLKSPKFPFPSV